MYLYSNQLADRGKKHLEKKNIVYTKDGMKVGVKDVKDEQLNDNVQRYGVPRSLDLSIPGHSANMLLSVRW